MSVPPVHVALGESISGWQPAMPARTQPDPDAIVHQHLHAVGASIGEEVGVVRLGRPEGLDNALLIATEN
ncbi:hypothetical protein QTI51_26655 [Variovorax sp. J22G73]|nr:MULTISPECIES: hypothetical protein [unclassified Variovorax]MDM0008381.1 hypothetical protein [Variovorax sp. J22R203]MDM0100888.1 hypothetical protein [Variovorax sp. J22G73]